MKYDTTAPAKANEWLSLAILVGVVLVAAGAITFTVAFVSAVKKPIAVAPLPPPPSTASAQTEAALAAMRGEPSDGVNRIRDDYVVVHGGSVYINIYGKGNELMILRAPPRGDAAAMERWSFARIIQAIVNNPGTAERYSVQDLVPKLRELNVHIPSVTQGQMARIRELYADAFAARGVDRIKADQALTDFVSKLALSTEDQQNFEKSVEKARQLFTPAQLEFIKTGRRPPPTTPATPATTTPATQ